MILVLFGKPGAGKGTQAPLLSKAIGAPPLATGDVLRAARRTGTALGKEAQSFMDRGELVPDSVILGIVAEELQKPAYTTGAILDGVVRTVPQAEGLDAMLAQSGRRVNAVLVFDIANEEIVRRLSSRTVCEKCQTPYMDRDPGTVCEKCGGTLVRRADDEPDAVLNRLRVYEEQTAPVLDWYRKMGQTVAVIDAVGDVDDVTARALRALGK